MKKQISVLLAVLIFVLSMSVQAVEPRDIAVVPRLSFSGTTANCSVTCKGENTSDRVSVTMTLYQGNTYVDSWSSSGTNRVVLSGNCQVTKGKSYTLKVTYSVNGSTKPSASTTATCPG